MEGMCVHRWLGTQKCFRKHGEHQNARRADKAFFSDEDFDDVEDKATYKSMLTRDERRFKTADRDGDGIATREEFTAFLHPEEFDYMKDVVVQVESAL